MVRSSVLSGARAAPIEMHQFPISSIAPTALEFRSVYANGKPIAGLPYSASLADGTVKTGKTDASGVGRIDGTHAGSAKISYGEDYNPTESNAQSAAHDDFKNLTSSAAKKTPKV